MILYIIIYYIIYYYNLLKMPKISIDYSNCSIYKLEHIEDETLIYVGHTTNFKQRKAQHKKCCNNENNKGFNCKLYTMMRANGGFEMFKMIEIEKYKCFDRREADKRENELMKELKASMNKNRSFVTEEENKQYYEYNKEKILKKQKEYYDDNKDKSKQYYEDNKDKKKQYREDNKDKIKQYYEDNKDKILKQHKEYYEEKAKQYYEDNKDKILKKKKEYYEENNKKS